MQSTESGLSCQVGTGSAAARGNQTRNSAKHMQEEQNEAYTDELYSAPRWAIFNMLLVYCVEVNGGHSPLFLFSSMASTGFHPDLNTSFHATPVR